MKIMQKVSQWFNSLNNASKIRARHNKFFSVKNQLSAINIVLFSLGIMYVLWAAGYVWFDVGADAMPGAMACLAIICWLCGLRLAIASSKDARERYIQKTVRALGNFGKFIFWSAFICLVLGLQIIVLCAAIKMGYFDKLIEVYPAMELLSQSINLQVNEMLEKLLPFIG